MGYKCLIADDEEPARDLLITYAEQLNHLRVDHVCKNGAEILNALRDHEIDILFLDIQMPKLKGTEIVPLIKGKLPVFIFTTAYDQYALDAFDLNAVDYLLKPFGFNRFVQAVDKAIERVDASRGKAPKEDASFMMVKSEYKLIRVNYRDILYIEALREYVRIYMANDDVLTLDTMKNMESVLPSSKFIRVHKSYIVALNKIKSLQGNQVEIADKKLPIGRSYKASLMGILNTDNNHGL